MEQEIRHRRLHAFYNSKVNNALVLVSVVGLMLMVCTKTMLPAIVSLLAMAAFVVYSLRLWIKKPRHIKINKMLSDIDSLYFLYYLIIGTVDPANEWWYIIPIALSLPILIITLLGYGDQDFDI